MGCFPSLLPTLGEDGRQGTPRAARGAWPGEKTAVLTPPAALAPTGRLCCESSRDN